MNCYRLTQHFITLFLVTAIGLGGDQPSKAYTYAYGGIIRGDQTKKQIALVFTGGDFGEGGSTIREILHQRKILSSFFFTGDFYRNKAFDSTINDLIQDGHYLGAHSDKHLLYCSWEKRDSLLVNHQQFYEDLSANYAELKRFGIEKDEAPFFMPPYEWYNDTISVWCNREGIQLINYSPGTLSNADYTIPSMHNYRSTETIFRSIINFEEKEKTGLNGFILLLHIGTHPDRTDKFYFRLGELIDVLALKGYQFVRIDQLLQP